MTDSAYPDLANVEDWLNAKGYTGEAGACHNAMDKIRQGRPHRGVGSGAETTERRYK